MYLSDIFHFTYAKVSKNSNSGLSAYDFVNKELIPGLWYYDDGYENPNFFKKIDELIQKNKYRVDN